MKNNIKKININYEIKSSYIDYAMSVIVSRALPDVRDGLKPVHRRILYAMYKLGINYNKNYKKSARIVGEVLGKFHPHGDKSVYDSIVRMTQKWNIRYSLINGQGNFGSLDNDPPAAMRYTEIKLDKITKEMLDDINNNTVDMKKNFDDTLYEPKILPTKIPNILINGASGIAVGMATNMPPHNLNNTIDAICQYIDNYDISINKLIKIIKAPDFPTGGIILYSDGIKKAYKTGKGKIIIRSKFYLKEIKKKKYIIIKEIPYQVIKSNLIKKIYNLIKIGKIEDIQDIKDESNKNGIRILLLLKNNSIPELIINKLLKLSDLQIIYHINNIALVNNKPKRLNLKKLIYYFIEHRNDIIIRRAQYFLSFFKEKLHLLKGFIKIYDKIDKILLLIKKSISYNDSFKLIKNKFNLSNNQVKFILNIKLYKFTNKEIKNYFKKYKNLKININKNKKIVNSRKTRMNIIKKELLEIKKKYGDNRKTLIDYYKNDYLNNNENNDKVLLIITKKGYIKRTLLSEYKIQNRGGIGSRGITINKDDNIKHVIISNNNYIIIFFTKSGKCHNLKINDIPLGNKLYRGRAIQNFLNINKEINTYIIVKSLKNKKYIKNHNIILGTNFGIVKRTNLNKFSNIRKNGIRAINIKKKDNLLVAKLSDGKSKILIAINSGKCLIFNENNIKLTNRNTKGVKGINLNNKYDRVIGMVIFKKKIKKDVLVVSEHGYGKRTLLNNYRVTKRGGVGVKTINITKKTGKLISILVVNSDDDIIIIKNTGILLRISVSKIRIVGRNSQGVKLIKLNNKEKIADVVLVKKN